MQWRSTPTLRTQESCCRFSARPIQFGARRLLIVSSGVYRKLGRRWRRRRGHCEAKLSLGCLCSLCKWHGALDLHYIKANADERALECAPSHRIYIYMWHVFSAAPRMQMTGRHSGEIKTCDFAVGRNEIDQIALLPLRLIKYPNWIWCMRWESARKSQPAIGHAKPQSDFLFERLGWKR